MDSKSPNLELPQFKLELQWLLMEVPEGRNPKFSRIKKKGRTVIGKIPKSNKFVSSSSSIVKFEASVHLLSLVSHSHLQSSEFVVHPLTVGVLGHRVLPVGCGAVRRGRPVGLGACAAVFQCLLLIFSISQVLIQSFNLILNF
ncbi:hypothetical protein R6Q57_021474 [Mikania cordata]